MIILTRNGLTLSLSEGMIPAQGSSDVPIQYINDTDDYMDYLITPIVGWIQANGLPKASICEYSNGIIKIPAGAFIQSGIISIAIQMIDPSDSSHIEVTYQAVANVQKVPNASIKLPAEPIWHKFITDYMNQYFDSEFDDRIQFWINENQVTFDEWFEQIVGKLGSDPAGELQLQINDIVNGPTKVNKAANADSSTNAIKLNDQEASYYASKSSVDTERAERKQEIEVERQRINAFTKLAEGSTTGDAELQDIRVGFDGTIYENAGNAVRNQASDIKEDISNFASDLFIENGFNSEIAIDGKYIDISGAIVDSSAWSYSEEYIKINPNKTYYALSSSDYPLSNVMYSIAMYDGNKKFIGVHYNKGTHVITPLENTRYIRISVHTNRKNDFMFTEYDSVEEYKPYGFNFTFAPKSHVKCQQIIDIDYLKKSNILYGKTLVTCGDSITYGADMDEEGILEDGTLMTYGWQIANRNNMVFHKDAISGSTMQGIDDKNGFSLENGRYTKLPEHIDYLTIFFGWNDHAYGTLGTINDNTNQTFYGGYNVVMQYLINKYPYTKIVLIVPFGTTSQHRQAVRDIANKWGVACFDMFQGGTPLYFNKEDDVSVEPSVIESNRLKFQANGAHPNYRGHYQISTMLEHFLRSI